MSEIQFDNVDSSLTCFKDLKDPRSHINRRHLFGDLLVICIMAVIAGADGPEAIGTWAGNNRVWLKKHLKLPGGIPSHDTLGRVLGALKPPALAVSASGLKASTDQGPLSSAQAKFIQLSSGQGPFSLTHKQGATTLAGYTYVYDGMSRLTIVN